MTKVRTAIWQRVIAVFGLVVVSPLLAVAAIVIKRSSPGPVVYRAARAGLGGREFVMFKLRTMHVGLESQGSITAAGDARVFSAGRWIRALKLDEFPQLVNVVAGQMALVGPRPEAIDIVRDSYEPWMMETLTVPPGITGPGSLRYIQQHEEMADDPIEARRAYAADVLPQKLARELVYVRNRSFLYEVQLILRTVAGVFGFRGFLRRVADTETRQADAILDAITSGASR